LHRIEKLLELLDGEVEAYEIVINDFGVLGLLDAVPSGRRPAALLGRLLTKLKRGPRLAQHAKRISAAELDHFRRSGADHPRYAAFLVERGVERYEFDHPLHGLTRDPGAVRGSLYYPYVYVSTGRYCPFAEPNDRDRPLRRIAACNMECAETSLTLRSPAMPVDLLLRGSTYFYRNDDLPDDLAALSIDRLVFAPELPA